MTSTNALTAPPTSRSSGSRSIHRHGLWFIVLLMFAALLPTAPAAADRLSGDRLDLNTTSNFPADTPFHIMHGWFGEPGEVNRGGQFGWSLDIDGVDQGRGRPTMIIDRSEPGAIVQRQSTLYNFADGLPAGTYVMTGHWFIPCQWLADEGLIDECSHPNEPIEAFTEEFVVEFD